MRERRDNLLCELFGVVVARRLLTMIAMAHSVARKRGAVLEAAKRSERNHLRYVGAVFHRPPGDARPRSNAAKRKILRTMHLDGSPLAEWRGDALYFTDPAGHGIDRDRFPRAAAWADLVLIDQLPVCIAAREAMKRGGLDRTLAGARKAVLKDLGASGHWRLWDSHKKRPGKGA